MDSILPEVLKAVEAGQPRSVVLFRTYALAQDAARVFTTMCDGAKGSRVAPMVRIGEQVVFFLTADHFFHWMMGRYGYGIFYDTYTEDYINGNQTLKEQVEHHCRIQERSLGLYPRVKEDDVDE